MGYGFLYWTAYCFWWPLIFVALLPLALAAESQRVALSVVSTGLVTCATWLGVYSFFAVYSFSGLFAIGAYHGLTVSLVVFAAQWVRTRTRLPMALTLPCLWTGSEVWRMMGPIGLPLGLLAPPVGENLWMIQISDLFGLYGVSFAIAMVSGLGADLIRCSQGKGMEIKHWFTPQLRVGVFTTASVWLFIAVYGVFRLVESTRTMMPGPVTTVVQTDIPTKSNIAHGFDPDRMLNDMFRFSNEGLSMEPELIVWPEAMAGMPPLNQDWLALAVRAQPEPAASPETELRQRSLRFYRSLTNWVSQKSVPLLLGSPSRSTNSLSGFGETDRRNTARLLLPIKGAQVQLQDKVRLFPIGETLPWTGIPLFEWLNSKGVIPASFQRKQTLTPGSSHNVFRFPRSRIQNTREEWRFAVSICSEIMFPTGSLSTSISEDRGKPIDFIVNISNNGGFQRNRASLFHALLVPFRAVEGRVGVARSSNAGISGFAKPTGEIWGEIRNERGQRWTGKGAPELDLIEQIVRIRNNNAVSIGTNRTLNLKLKRMIERVEELRSDAGISGQSTQPIWIDRRVSLYSRIGDLFGYVMLLILTSASVLAIHGRIRSGIKQSSGGGSN